MGTVLAPSRAMLCMPTSLIFGQASLEDPAAINVAAIAATVRRSMCIVAARKGMSKTVFNESSRARKIRQGARPEDKPQRATTSSAGGLSEQRPSATVPSIPMANNWKRPLCHRGLIRPEKKT